MNAVNQIKASFSETPENFPESVKPLKIALLGYRSKPHCGGQGVYLRYLSAALADLGHEVHVISGEPYPELDPRIQLVKIPGLNLFETNHLFALRFRHFKSFTDLFEYFSMLTGGFPEPYTWGRRMLKYLNSHEHDYDIIHDNQSLGFSLLSLQKTGTPLLATIHHPITNDLKIAMASTKSPIQKALTWRWHLFLLMQKYVVQRLKNVVTVSQQSQKDIASDFKIREEDISLVYNGIDTSMFKPNTSIKRLPMRLMATASADVPLKGLNYLVEAMGILIKDYPELELVVLGKPNPGGMTEKLILQLKLSNHIFFVNNLETQEIVDYYAQTSIAVVPSVYEGFGLPAGEAMACGLPVVSTNGGALPEVVGDAGIIVPVKDSKAIAREIKNLLENSQLRDELGKKARHRIVNELSWEQAAIKMTRLYHDITEKTQVKAS